MKDDTLKTSELGLAASLDLLGFKITIQQLDRNKAMFVFDSTEEIIQQVDRYWKHELRVDPQDFMQRIKTLKARIWDILRYNQ